MVRPCGEMENDRNAKRVYVEECAGRQSVVPRKRWIDAVKNCLKK